jgi:signal peptidase I
MPQWVSNLFSRAGLLTKGVRIAGLTYFGAALALIVLLAIPAVLALFGYRAYVVYGGSMGRSLPNGSIGITERVQPEDVNVGDVVAIKRSTHSLPLLHRVIEVDTSDGTRKFVTQGDANKEPDPNPISLRGSGDRIVFSIPWLGHIVHFARSPFGRAVLLIVPVTLLVGVVLWETWKDVGKRPYFGEEPQC